MAKFKIEWSTQANFDLSDILEYYNTAHGNNNYSQKLFTLIDEHIEHLPENPLLGMATEYKNVRLLIAGNYHIMYEISDYIILIIMIWDARRNPNDKNIERRIS